MGTRDPVVGRTGRLSAISQRARRSALVRARGSAIAGIARYRHDPRRLRARKDYVVLDTATSGGGFPLYGAAYCATLNEFDRTLSVEPRNTKGSTENIPLIEAGKIDLGLATGEVTYEALAGVGRAPADLRIVSAMYPNSGLFVVRADSPYRTLGDLRGKSIAWGARGSGFVVLVRCVFDGLGLGLDQDFQPARFNRSLS